jgi:hypothetical protein
MIHVFPPSLLANVFNGRGVRVRFSRIWHADVIGTDTWNQIEGGIMDLLWWTPVPSAVDGSGLQALYIS